MSGKTRVLLSKNNGNWSRQYCRGLRVSNDLPFANFLQKAVKKVTSIRHSKRKKSIFGPFHVHTFFRPFRGKTTLSFDMARLLKYPGPIHCSVNDTLYSISDISDELTNRPVRYFGRVQMIEILRLILLSNFVPQSSRPN